MKSVAEENFPAEKMENAYVFVDESDVHHKGLFAKKDIPKGTQMVEYIGPLVPKKEGNRLSKDGNVYVFSLDRKYDIDGSVPWNLARYANHSCRPNTESVGRDNQIWLEAMRDIKEGEEITYDYCYGVSEYKDNPCECGHENCFGYIVSQKHIHKVKKNESDENTG